LPDPFAVLRPGAAAASGRPTLILLAGLVVLLSPRPNPARAAGKEGTAHPPRRRYLEGSGSGSRMYASVPGDTA
jgi:hypothetical protein